MDPETKKNYRYIVKLCCRIPNKICTRFFKMILGIFKILTENYESKRFESISSKTSLFYLPFLTFEIF